jgi:hypothetical protein
MVLVYLMFIIIYIFTEALDSPYKKRQHYYKRDTQDLLFSSSFKLFVEFCSSVSIDTKKFFINFEFLIFISRS